MLVYRTLESRLDVLMKQRDLVNGRIVEIMSTIASIDEIGKNKEDVLFKLGGEAYAYGNVNDKNKILVEIGAGVVVELSIEDGKETLNKREKEMENALKEIQNNVSQISNMMNQLGPEINELIHKTQDKTIAG